MNLSRRYWLVVACLAGFFVGSFGFMASHHLEDAVTVWDRGTTDFTVWYRTALVIQNPEKRADIYALQDGEERVATGFFNPPSMAFLLWPLTQLEFREGRTAM